MATKLKNLKVGKVDFVDAGANQEAYIKILKKNAKDGGSKDEKNTGSVWKKLFGFIGKAAGMDQDEIDSAVEDIQKGDAMSFNERFLEVQNRKISDEIWDICYALQASLCSILNDEDADTEQAMKESVTEFCEVVQECITQWSSGKESGVVKKNTQVTEEELEIMKSAAARLNDTLEKAAVVKETSSLNNNQKGEITEMVDKSKMTDAERAFYEDIEKRYKVDIGDYGDMLSKVSTEPAVAKSAQAENKGASEPPTPVSEPQADDIYKGLHPAVKAELEELKKFRESAEDKELADVAKKYAILGKKEEELVPLFKSLRAAGGTAYNDMIAILDQSVEAVEKSGAFSEIGKSGNGFSATGAVEAKVDTIAKGYMEKDSSLDYTAAVAKAWEEHPELMDEYEEEAGF